MSHPSPPSPPASGVGDDAAGGAAATDRRGLILGLAVTAVAGVAGYVVASGRDDGDGTGGAPAADSGGAGERLVALADVPAGGGVIPKGAGVVVTRDGDQVRAFSATCTHQGCTVTSVDGGIINCNCHGSRFDAATGAPVGGPAPRPLPPVSVEVRDGAVFRT
jgi:Rieske Fe-S protein